MPVSYAISVKNGFHPSGTTLGSSVAMIRATDNENDPMVFSLDSSVQDLLQIDNTGNLTLQKELDREVSWQMTITLPRMKQIAREIGKMAVHRFVDQNLETGQFSRH